MKARIDYANVPEALRGMYQLEHYIHNSGLQESLVHLVKMRASQYAELTADDQLRQTTFLGWSDDKKAKEVVLEPTQVA